MDTGVKFTEPPRASLANINDAIAKAIADLPTGSHAALGLQANQTEGNAVVVAKLDHGFDVKLWIGKAWAEPGVEYGAVLRKVW